VADATFVSQQGAYDQAVSAQTRYANCVMHLFQQSLISPTPLNSAADFLAAEADFDGYAPATIATWADPVLAGPAWAIYAPTQTFRFVYDTGVVNSIGGYFLLTAGGDLIGYTTFDPAENAASMGQAIIRTPVDVFPWGQGWFEGHRGDTSSFFACQRFEIINYVLRGVLKMPIFRVTYGFSGDGIGWTESHSMFSAAPTAAIAMGNTLTVAQTRAAMLARPFQLVGRRVSIYSDGAVPAVRLPRSVRLDKTKFGPGGRTAAWAAEPASVQYQAIGTAPANVTPAAFAGNTNYTFLGGPPDTTVTDDGTVLPAENNLMANFNAWVSALVQANHGWLAVNRATPLDISMFTQNPDATVTFTTDAVDLTKFVLGKVYPVRVRRVNGGRSPLNGALICKLLTATTWKTTEQVAFALAQTGGQLTPYLAVLQHVPYFNVQLGMEVVKHKRGKPFLSEPGRRSKRVRA
jgi:hypothetical protein